MRLLLMADTFVAVFFALGVAFFAKTLPWPWAVAFSIPAVAAYLIYTKLGRVEASMNETVREYETFFADRKKLIYPIWLVLIAIGTALIFGFAGDAKLLPSDETNAMLGRVNAISTELEAIRKTVEAENAKAETRSADLLDVEREIAGKTASLESKIGILNEIEADARNHAATADKTRQTLESIDKTLKELKEILIRQEEVKK